MKLHKSGMVGIAVTIIGIALLLFTFRVAYDIFQSYSIVKIASGDFLASINQLLVAAIQAMFLGIMAWVGAILLVRGVDFFKVDRGIGVVTFRVEKGVGIATSSEEQEGARSKEVSK